MAFDLALLFLWLPVSGPCAVTGCSASIGVRLSIDRGHCEARQFGSEGLLDAQGISCDQLVLLGQQTGAPKARRHLGCKLIELTEKLIAQLCRRFWAKRRRNRNRPEPLQSSDQPFGTALGADPH